MKRFLLIFIAISSFGASAIAQDFRWTQEPDDDCELKRLNPTKTWERVDPTGLGDEVFQIEKEYDTGSVSFKHNEVWYGTQKKCLDPVRNEFEPKDATRSLFAFGYQRTNTGQIVGSGEKAALGKVDDVWMGLLLGLQHEYYKKSGFRVHDGYELQIGQSIVRKEQVFSLGARLFGGIGTPVTDRILVAIEPSFVIRYGQFPVGGSNLFFLLQAAFNQEYRLSSKQSIRLSEGIPLFETNSFYLAIGVTSDIP